MCLQLVEGAGGQGGKDVSERAWRDTFRYAWLISFYSAGFAAFSSAAHAAPGLFWALSTITISSFRVLAWIPNVLASAEGVSQSTERALRTLRHSAHAVPGYVLKSL